MIEKGAEIVYNKIENYESKEVNQKELAWYFGVTTRCIRGLTNDYGLFKKENKKTYNLQKCVEEYIKFLKENQKKTDSRKDLDYVKWEHENIKKDISALHLKRLKNNCHDSKDVEDFITNMLISFKNRLISIPSKIAPLIIGEDDINEVINIIEKEIFETLDTLSEYDPLKINKTDIDLYDDDDEIDDGEKG